MPNTLLRAGFILFILVNLTACVSTYHHRARSAHQAFQRGEYDRAVKLIEKVRPSARDRLLHLLDQGMILHAAGQYSESNVVLARAEQLSDELSVKSISREAAATLWSEEATEDAGERHERVMIPVVRMLNYIMLDDWDGALVEVRRIEYLAEKVYGRAQEFYNPFATYLSAVIWETLGYINDALIDYRRLAKKESQLPYYGHDLEQMSRKLGLKVPLPSSRSGAWRVTPRYRRDKGQLLVIVESGLAPHFVSEYVTAGHFTMALPALVASPSLVDHATVSVDGRLMGQTYPFYNIADDIIRAAEERRRRSMVRKIIKLSAQTALYATAFELMGKEEKDSAMAGFLVGMLGFSMSAAERADERSWRTLPATFQLGRFYLPPGVHDVEIVPAGGVGVAVKRRVEIVSQKPTTLLVRFPEFGPRAEKLALAERPELISEPQQKRYDLVDALKEDPTNGDLKIDLALTRMEQGDYDVEAILEAGLRDGGDRRKGVEALVVSHTVKGKYKRARRWAQRGVKEELGDNFAFYAEAASYLLDSSKRRPENIDLAEEASLTNAFNHFVVGLLDEKDENYNSASEMLAQAYRLGLVGKPVVKRFMAAYRQADDEFKKSPKGIDLISEFSDDLMPHLVHRD